MSSFWIWVANSAFRGIREEQDILLGLICVMFVLVPLAGSVVAFAHGRARRSTRRGIERGAITMVLLQSLSLVCGVIVSGPF